MPALASLADLRRMEEQVAGLKSRHPEAFDDFTALLRGSRWMGYRNICRLLLGETTPERLKEGG